MAARDLQTPAGLCKARDGRAEEAELGRQRAGAFSISRTPLLGDLGDPQRRRALRKEFTRHREREIFELRVWVLPQLL